MKPPHSPWALALLALLVAGGTAWAQDQPAEPPLPPALESARSAIEDGRLEEGAAALEKLHSEGALDLPHQALLGALYLETGQPDRALEILDPLASADGAPAAVLFNTWRATAAAGEPRPELLTRAAELEPLSPAGRMHGLDLGRQGRLHEAYRFLRPWALQNPDDQEVRLAAAMAAVQLERSQEAEELLSDLPNTEPRVRLLWGMLLLLQDDPHGALANLRALPEDLPASLDIDRRKGLARAHLQTGNASESIALLEAHVTNRPDIALLVARARAQTGDVEAAVAELEPFSQRILDDELVVGDLMASNLLSEYGQQMVAVGRGAEAIPFLERALEVDDQNKLSWRALGQALAAAGRREEAEKALEQFQYITDREVPSEAFAAVLAEDPDDPAGRKIRQAIRLLSMNRAAEALQTIRSEIELSPSSLRARLVESRALLALDRPEEALAAAQAAVDLNEAEPDAFYQRAVTKMALSQLTEAEQDFRQALGLNGSHVAALNDFAVLLMSRGQDDEARGLLERVLEINPEDILAARNLASLDAR